MPKFFVDGSSGDVNFGYEATGTTPKLTWDASAESVSLDSAVVINESGADVDFRIESDTDANAFFLDGATGDVSIGQNLKFNSGYGSVATAYGCRAWVNFDGTGTPAIRDSGNVSSISDQGTGQYYVNFSTAMPDDDFATFALANYVAGSSIGTTVFLDNTPLTTRTSLIVTAALNSNYSVRDCTDVSVAVFR